MALVSSGRDSLDALHAGSSSSSRPGRSRPTTPPSRRRSHPGTLPVRGEATTDATPEGTSPVVEGVWQWLTPRGVWQNHNRSATTALERAMRRSRPVCVINTVLGSLEVDMQRMVQHPQGSSFPERKVRRLDTGTGGAEETAAGEGARPSSGPSGLPRVPRSSSTAAVGARRSAGGRSSAVSSSSSTPSAHRSTRAAAALLRPISAHEIDGTLDEDEALAIALAFGEVEGRSSTPTGILSGAGAGIVAGTRPGRGSRAASEPRRTGSGGLAAFSPDSPDGDLALALRLAREEEMRFGGSSAAPSHAPRASADAMDIDRMSYEELLALGERIGYASRPDRSNTARLSRLPTRRVGDGPRGEEDDTECSICCCDYEAGEELRTLPCLHSFHRDCIDKWLCSDHPGARACPVCHTEVGI